MRANCLTRALDQWNEDKNMHLYYNSNHVISLEYAYSLIIITDSEGINKPLKYLPLESFGTFYFITSFQLSRKHLKLLGDYFNYQNPNVNII
jgi:hypothetical protein